ncbi:hypothetical protein T492DRAFT_879585 [Pavlovales sp. CCMP2436]|nr:hypothetical protein T492DRAFT_879585 [Pavlovales sp. CCMP2436]
MKVVAWTLGEYGYLSDEFEIEALVEFAVPDTRCWLMCAITKLCAQLPAAPEQAIEVATKYAASKSTSLQQYCVEFLNLSREHGTMAEVLPVDSSCDDLESLRNGGARYLPQNERPDEMQGYTDGGAGAPPAPPSAPTPAPMPVTPSGPGGYSPSVASYAQPPKPAVMSDKERMAAALFSGMGAPADRDEGSGRKRRAPVCGV